MSKINQSYKEIMAWMIYRITSNWTGNKEALLKELELMVEVIYEDGQQSVRDGQLS